jgi:ribose transport system substrate-binding protein
MVCVGALAACGGSDSSAGDGEKASSPEVAFLNFSASNTYITQTRKEMERIAAERGAKMTELDAANDPAKQQQQLQAVIASNRYDGLVISPLGPSLAVDVQAAAAAGMKVAVVGQPLGTDLNTPDPQVDGVGISVLAPPVALGRRLGEQALAACEGKDPCRVVWIYGIKGSPVDNAYLDGFKDTIAQNDAIKIVATGEGKYQGPDVALAAMQNILQSTPDFDVVVGADQSMQGVQLALEQTDKLDKVAIIALGGSRAAVDAITAGKWYGGVMTAPRTEGQLAMGGLLDLIQDGKLRGPDGVDPLTRLTNGGLITQENVKDVEPQWNG